MSIELKKYVCLVLGGNFSKKGQKQMGEREREALMVRTIAQEKSNEKVFNSLFLFKV